MEDENWKLYDQKEGQVWQAGEMWRDGVVLVTEVTQEKDTPWHQSIQDEVRREKESNSWSTNLWLKVTCAFQPQCQLQQKLQQQLKQAGAGGGLQQQRPERRAAHAKDQPQTQRFYSFWVYFWHC